MRTRFLSLVLTAAILPGCATNTQTGALAGTGVGAGAGALISPTPAGVLIGAGVGAATGALVGSALDPNEHAQVKEQSPKTAGRVKHREQLSIRDIERMTAAGISDDKIIATIHSTGSVFNLSTVDMENLRNAGVSQRVIDYMQQTAY